jgi:hypothetical protein
MRDGVTSLDVEDLSRAVATGGNISTVQTETHAAHDTLMRQVVDQVDVENTSRSRIEDGKPVASLFLQVLWQLLDI